MNMRKGIGFLMSLVVSPAWSQTLCLSRSDGLSIPPPYVIVMDYGAIPVVDMSIDFDALRRRRCLELGFELPRPNSWWILVPAFDRSVAVWTEIPVDEHGLVHLTIPCEISAGNNAPLGHLRSFRVVDEAGRPVSRADIFVSGTSARGVTSTKGELSFDHGFPMNSETGDLLIVKQGYNPAVLTAEFVDPWEVSPKKDVIELKSAPYASVVVTPELPTTMMMQEGNLELWAGFVPSWTHTYFLFLRNARSQLLWEGSVDLYRDFYGRTVSEAVAIPTTVRFRPSVPQHLPKFSLQRSNVPMVSVQLNQPGVIVHEPSKPKPQRQNFFGSWVRWLAWVSWSLGCLAIMWGAWSGTRRTRRWLHQRRPRSLTVPS